jgi:hypothetical protein
MPGYWMLDAGWQPATMPFFGPFLKTECPVFKKRCEDRQMDEKSKPYFSQAEGCHFTVFAL